MSNANMDNAIYHTTYEDYGKDWLISNGKTLEELGEDEIKLQYLEKCYKSKRRAEKLSNQQTGHDENINEKYKYDKNAIIAKKFPFTAADFHYPNQDKSKPKTLYITSNSTYGSIQPNDLELPEKFFPKDCWFTKYHGAAGMYHNAGLNCGQSRSKVHSSLDSVV